MRGFAIPPPVVLPRTPDTTAAPPPPPAQLQQGARSSQPLYSFMMDSGKDCAVDVLEAGPVAEGQDQQGIDRVGSRRLSWRAGHRPASLCSVVHRARINVFGALTLMLRAASCCQPDLAAQRSAAAAAYEEEAQNILRINYVCRTVRTVMSSRAAAQHEQDWHQDAHRVVDRLRAPAERRARAAEAGATPMSPRASDTETQLVSLMEIILRHGFKTKRSSRSPSKDVWGLFETSEPIDPMRRSPPRSLEKTSAAAAELCFAVRACPAKTDLGKTRAFVRFALMTVCHSMAALRLMPRQKCLADQIRAVIELPTLGEWSVLRSWIRGLTRAQVRALCLSHVRRGVCAGRPADGHQHCRMHARHHCLRRVCCGVR